MKIEISKIHKNVDFSIGKIHIVHVSIVFIRFANQTNRFMIFFCVENAKIIVYVGSVDFQNRKAEKFSENPSQKLFMVCSMALLTLFIILNNFL